MTASLAPDQAIACAGADPEQFFPAPGPQSRLRAKATAREYCATCPALTVCRDAPGPTTTGLWGGVLHVLDGTGRMHTTDLLNSPHHTTTRKVTRP